MVEFAIVLPLLVLLLCGTIDFGLMFGGYTTMENGVASVTRQLSLGDYTYGGTCTGGTGTTAGTAQAVCNVVASLGSLTGINTSTLTVGICFVPQGSTPSCSGSSALTQGSSDTDDVEVCASGALESTTGLTSIFVSGSRVTTSSRVLIEEPQPSGYAPFGNYNAGSTGANAVSYNGATVAGMTCT